MTKKCNYRKFTSSLSRLLGMQKNTVHQIKHICFNI